jgi:hypothetical protein
MNQHLEILSAETRNGRTFWTRIGTAFSTKDGKGYRLKLRYFPLSPEAEVLLLPAKAPQVKSVSDDEFNDPSFPFAS